MRDRSSALRSRSLSASARSLMHRVASRPMPRACTLLVPPPPLEMNGRARDAATMRPRLSPFASPLSSASRRAGRRAATVSRPPLQPIPLRLPRPAPRALAAAWPRPLSHRTPPSRLGLGRRGRRRREWLAAPDSEAARPVGSLREARLLGGVDLALDVLGRLGLERLLGLADPARDQLQRLWVGAKYELDLREGGGGLRG